MPSPASTGYQWLRSGDDAFAAMIAAIDAARQSIAFETYTYSPHGIGALIRNALIQACLRGVTVRVLIDAIGSITLPDSFWEPLRQAGGTMRWFNPISLGRFNIRNHRKLLACDDALCIIGGFNVAPECEGDGITRGWMDVGMQIHGALARELRISFDEMFDRADFQHQRFIRFRKRPRPSDSRDPAEALLLCGPGRGRSPIKQALMKDLADPVSVRILAAYFLPPRRLRRTLMRAARHGRRVELVLPGRSDVPLIQLASRSLYQRLLSAGVRIFEYQPQILHAKVILVDQVTYVGSSNLDARSLSINYELIARVVNSAASGEGDRLFEDILTRCRSIEEATWKRSRNFWKKLLERWAYLLFARLDPYLAHRQIKRLVASSGAGSGSEPGVSNAHRP